LSTIKTIQNLHHQETDKKVKKFQTKIWDFYSNNKRSFPWRNTKDPYKILVSEIMLQQTQTSRVTEKYNSFTQELPTTTSLAHASQVKVLHLWHGLGYNRRALFLKKASEIICLHKRERDFFSDPDFLINLPGVGPNTAGAIYVFSTNKPYVFIETNIRRVFIHEFFPDKENVSDNKLLPMIFRTLPKSNFRNWYYALMDYGAYLGKTIPNPNKKSAHYTIQSKFEGSQRQARGNILKLLLSKPLTKKDLALHFTNKEMFHIALEQLLKEGFITKKGKTIHIKP